MSKFNESSEISQLLDHVAELTQPAPIVEHRLILDELLSSIHRIDFRDVVHPQAKKLKEKLSQLDPDSPEYESTVKKLEKLKVSRNDKQVVVVNEVVRIARQNRWGICRGQIFTFIYNGAYWQTLDAGELKGFLGKAAEKMGVPEFEAKHFTFRDALLKQFESTEYLPTPSRDPEKVLINLKNGTFQIDRVSGNTLRNFRDSDFLTYQLPFDFDPAATAPLFQKYLDRVLPDKSSQAVLAEYMGYVFIRNSSKTLKLEKVLMLYGSGANGKSVFFEVVNALLGGENVASYSLQSLCDQNGYSRAMIGGKLVNYSSEISGGMEADALKKMASGEPIEARLPYGNPAILEDYAKLIFNVNTLPTAPEHTNAFFRRFLIIPFEVTIPEDEQDKELHSKIIRSELAGVFNWVLAGLDRLLKNKGFTPCEASDRARDAYKKESDSVALFIEDEGYRPDLINTIPLKEVYSDYKSFCAAFGYRALSIKNFSPRLKVSGFTSERKTAGMVVFALKKSAF